VLLSPVQLKDIAALTLDVKNQAMTTLEKAQKKKEHFENNNKKLKDFIKKIRDFLTGMKTPRLLFTSRGRSPSSSGE